MYVEGAMDTKKHVHELGYCNYFLVLTLLLVAGFANSDITKDKQECANQLVGIATCLTYVGGDAKAPTPDCCNGLKQVLLASKKCLCVLVKDRNDPTLGLNINATLALGLPAVCHAPANISECPALLNLAPNSPDAKVFQDFVNSAKGVSGTAAASTATGNSSSTSSGSSTNSDIKSDGGRGKRSTSWLAVVCVIIIIMVVHM